MHAQKVELYHLARQKCVMWWMCALSSSLCDIMCRKYVSQTKATTCTQHHDTSTWKVSAAPGHEEVIWGNLRYCILASV